MYVEMKTGHDGDGPASIGWVTLSKTGRTLTYRGRVLERFDGLVGNWRDTVTGEELWVSSVKRDRHHRRGAGTGPVQVDDDARQEYERITSSPEPRSRQRDLAEPSGLARDEAPFAQVKGGLRGAGL